MGEARPQSADHLPFGPRRRQTAASPSGQLELPTQSSRRAFGKAVVQRLNSPALRGFMRKVRWNDGLASFP